MSAEQGRPEIPGGPCKLVIARLGLQRYSALGRAEQDGCREEPGGRTVVKAEGRGWSRRYCAVSILIATSPRLQGIGGRYFEDCNEAPVIEPGSTPNARFGVARYAIDPTNAMRLWDLSQDNHS